jgi:teichuronic acid biosynthesis protein TuaE
MKNSQLLTRFLPPFILIAFFAVLIALDIKIALIVFAGIVGIVATLKYPGFVVICAIIVIGINTEVYTSTKSLFSGSIEKIVVLVALVPLVVSNQVRFRIFPIIFVYVILFAYTFVVSTMPDSLTFLQASKTFAGLIFGWLIAGLILPARLSRRIQILLMLLPVICVLIGIVLQVAGLWTVFGREWGTGALRLQGAQKAAQLAGISVIAIAAGLSNLFHGRGKYFNLALIIINLGILVATGGRSALMMGVFIILYIVLPTFINRLQTTWRIPKPVLILTVFFGVVLLIAIPIVIDRTFTTYNSSDLAINTSNRWPTWQFYWSQAKVNPVFGRGMGANVVIPSETTEKILGAPHNEYLRTVVDSGFVGLVLVLIGLLTTMRMVLAKVKGRDHKILEAVFISVLVVAFVDNIFNNTQFTAALGFLIASTISTSISQPEKKDIEPISPTLVEQTG